MSEPKKKVSVKVYFDNDMQTYNRVLALSKKTGLSVSAVAGLAIRHGLPVVEKSFQSLVKSSPVKVKS